MDIKRWRGLMSAWGFGENQNVFNALVVAYSQKHRHYHTYQHIDACLRHFDNSISQLDRPHEVELALWFHDAVYNPLSGKNELKSANRATSFLSESSADPKSIARVHQLIMVTEHDAPTRTQDESVLVDIDLSILGSDEQTYNTFEANVRKEYKMVPMFMYRKKRAAILEAFLERSAIYQTEPFVTDLEQQARLNLRRATSMLLGRV